MEELWKGLVEKGLYTKSFSEFQEQYNNQEGVKKLHTGLVNKNLYTKSEEDFANQYGFVSTPNVIAASQSAGESSVGSTSEDELPEDKGWFEDMFTAISGGAKAGSGVGEAFDVYRQGRNISEEDLKGYVKAANAMSENPETNEAASWRTDTEKYGGGFLGGFMGLLENPGYAPQFIASSFATMVSSLVDSEEVAAATTVGAGVGYGAGSGIGALGGSIGGPIGTALGYVGGGAAGAIGGGMAGLVGAMETGLTLTDLLRDELGDKDFNEKNIRVLLNDKDVMDRVKSRSLARGLTIGAVEGLTMGLSRGVGGKIITSAATKGAVGLSKAGLKTGAKVAAATTGVEMVGGGGGEALGMLAAGQELKGEEIFLEAIGEAKGAVNTSDIVKSALTNTSYKLNGEDVTADKIKETIDNPNTSKADLAKMKIEVTGDKAFDNYVKSKQNDAIIDSQIDTRITDQKDRDKLTELEIKREKAKADTKKEGAYKVPDAEKKLSDIENEISDIIGKYEGAVGYGETETAKEVAKVRRDIKISDTIAFAEAAGKKIGKDVHVADDNASAQELFNKIREEHNKNAEEYNAANPDDQIKLIEDEDVSNADGFIAGDSIVINKDIAGRRGAISVGSHEILHGILAKHMQGLDVSGKKELISSFKNVLSEKQLTAVTKRLQDNYQEQIQEDPEFLETTDEWFTAFSDAIEKGQITFEDTLFTKIRDILHKVFKRYNVNKEFADGQAAYDFLKEYHKNVQEGKLGKRAIALAGGGVTASETSFSRSKAVEAVNAIEDVIRKGALGRDGKYTKKDFQESREFDDVLDSIIENGGAINSYIKAVVKSPKEREKAIRILGERLLNYDPQAQRKTDSTEPVTIGEFLMANKDFARLVAKKELAVEGQEQATTTSIDTQDQYGRTVSETIADTTEETVADTKKQQKQRVLQSLAEVTLDNKKIINLKTQLKIADLIEQNPANLEERLTELVKKEVTKAVQKEMGGISFKKGEVKVSEEYKAFMAFNYENIIKGLDVTTIKNNYKTLFELTKIGVEEKRTKKADKPSLKKDSNFRKAVFKIETNKAKFTKFFTDTASDVKPQSHFNKLRGRQAGLAKLIAEGIVKDAINTEIEETSTNIDAIVEAKLRDFANKLDRQKSEVLGNYNDQVKFSKTKVQAALDLKNLIESGEIVFDTNGKYLSKYIKKYSKEVRDFVYKELYAAGLLKDANDLKFIGAAFRKLVKAGKRGIQYEAFLIDQAIAIEKKYGKDVLEVTMREPSEKGGLPDIQIRIQGQLFNIEAKMSNAQYSSVTFAVDANGNFIIKKDYTFNDALMEALGKPAQEKINQVKKHLKKKYGYDWSLGMPLPSKYYSDFKELVGTTLASMEIDLDLVSEIYNKKANYPVSTIQLMGRGLFHMGDGPNPLNLPKLEGKAVINLRVIPNTQYTKVDIKNINNMSDTELLALAEKMKDPEYFRPVQRVATEFETGSASRNDLIKAIKVQRAKSYSRVKTGLKTLTFRAIPIIPKSTLETLKSDKSIGSLARVDALVRSKEVAAMETQRKAKEAKTVGKATAYSRSGTKKLIDGLAESDVIDAVSGVNPNEYSNIRFSKSHRAEYEKRLLKKNADIGTAKEAAAHIDALFNWVDSSEVPAKKKSKFEKLALHYMVNNKLRMPEDGYKVVEAEKLAEAKKVDPFSFKNPNEIIEKYSGEVTKKNPNPDQHLKENDNIGAFSNKRELKNGVTMYDVKNGYPGMLATRNMVNEHFGKKSNPWCITQAIDGEITPTAKEHWDQYGDKQIVFKDGKLLAMRTESKEGPLTDAGDIEFWSRENIKFNEVPGNNYVDEQGREVRSSFNEKTGEDSGIVYGATKGSVESGKVEIYNTYTKDGNYSPHSLFGTKLGEGVRPKLYLEQVERYNKDGQLHGIQEEHISPVEMESGSYMSSMILTKEYKNGDFIGSRTDYGDGQGLGSFREKLDDKAFARGTVFETLNSEGERLNVMFSKSSKGISVLDFDDTLATTKSNVLYTMPDGTEGTLNAEEFAKQGGGLLAQGAKFDFSEFNKVVEGKTAPLFNKAMKLAGKFGTDNMFVLTARSPESAKAIKQFLDAQGLDIPLKNITGLGKSEAEAKALWIAEKVGEGYNDFYFADDAIQNVKAVKNMLDQFDVKSKVQQARVKFSQSMDSEFNKILEDILGIEAVKRFSSMKARKRGESKGKFRFFIPPSHEDFVGLLYNFMGVGRKGNAHRDFLEQALIRPLNRANKELDTARQSIANDFKSLNKRFPDVKSKLKKKTPEGDFTNEDAIRVYLWDTNGYDIPGITKTDQKNLVDYINSNPELKAYADTLSVISKQESYVSPTEGWESGDIRMDLNDATGRVGREEYFAEFLQNTDIIFSEENLNKIEAGYGKGVREALEDMLYRIKTGRNRPSGSNALVNRFVNYINGAVGSVMFFNIRSAVLQQMSIVNYINFADNNMFNAAKAFADQKQYWSDWSYVFNSDMLKQRRVGIQTDVNGSELAETISKSKFPMRTLIRELLKIGFTPTQIGDNIAIATGGATYYRNRIKTYLKQGLSKTEAEAKAWTDFQDITQSTQQSARPDMVSQQQASPLGKFILAFQNVTSQFNRLGKKAFLDIKNRRITKPNTSQFQSDVSNASRIMYYFAVQNMIFYGLQTALFAAMFDDNEDDEKFLKKKERMINGSIDSVLRGSGVMGAVVATMKNMAMKFAEQREAGYNKDESAVLMEMLNVSPPLGIKARKIVNAEKTLNYNKKAIEEMETFDIDNPQWSAATSYIEGVTNVPVNRLYNKTQNMREALNNQHSAWQRALMFMGWSKYNLGANEEEKNSTSSKSKSTSRGSSSRSGSSRGGGKR